MSRQCFFIPHNSFVKGKGYIPALVVEDEPGYRLLAGSKEGQEPWYWGMTLDEAKQIADQQNLQVYNLTPEDTSVIVASSMKAQNIAERSRGRRV